MEKEWSTFMDGDDCNECRNYEREERRLKKRIADLEQEKLDWNYCQTEIEELHTKVQGFESLAQEFIDHASKHSLIGQTNRWKEKFKEWLK